MASVISPNFSKPDSKIRNLVQRMSRFDLSDRIELIENSFQRILFKTGFSLADQVLLHAIVGNRATVDVVVEAYFDETNQNLASLRSITSDLYGISLDHVSSADSDLMLTTRNDYKAGDKFMPRDRFNKTPVVNPLADWTKESLVEYVLAHEVPVNPEDMPGFDVKAA